MNFRRMIPVTSPIPMTRQTRPSTSTKKLIALGLCTALILILFVPIFPWFQVTDQDALYGAMGLKATVIKKLTPNHSVLTFLSFVETSKQGVLGFWAFLLLIVSAAAIILCLLSVFTYFRRRSVPEGKGMLRVYSFFQKGMLLSFLSAAGTIGLIIFANQHYGLQGFMPGFAPLLTLAVSLVGYGISKHLEKAERIICREHGFVEEFRRNWVLSCSWCPASFSSSSTITCP